MELDFRIEGMIATDIAAIFDVHAKAFKSDAEARLVNMLRDDDDLIFSYSAVKGDDVIGHIALSPMRIEDAEIRALGLGPIGVLPEYQDVGVGSQLMHHAIDWARSNGWQMIMLLGNPAYYRRFGFSTKSAIAFASPYAGPNWQALMLDESVNKPQSAKAHYADAFQRL